MDAERERQEEQAALKRVVAKLLSLAQLADVASVAPFIVRCFLLWILRYGESHARNFVVGLADGVGVDCLDLADDKSMLERDSQAEACDMAERLRLLATVLANLTVLIAWMEGGADGYPKSRSIIRRLLLLLEAGRHFYNGVIPPTTSHQLQARGPPRVRLFADR